MLGCILRETEHGRTERSCRGATGSLPGSRLARGGVDSPITLQLQKIFLSDPRPLPSPLPTKLSLRTLIPPASSPSRLLKAI